MKIFQTFIILMILALSVFAQKPDEVLATAANNRSFTPKNLSPEAQKIWESQAALIADARSQMLSEMVADALFEIEAKASNMSVEKLLEAVRAKIPMPKEAEISAVYEANRTVFGDKTLEQVKPQIVAFLRREPEQKALQNVVDGLRTKYKVVFGKDVNDANLKSLDAVVTMSGKTISAQEFEEKNKSALYDLKANIYDRVMFDLKESVSSELVKAEAAELKIAVSDFIAREITDKKRDFSDEEGEKLTADLENKLFAKYKVQFLMKEPAPFAQSISADDDPSQGKTNAPVTVVMFSDFQCPACAATHPILKKVVAEFGDKVRLVIRDFPLTEIHENAFQAAVAAKAAFNQGKFFEYGEKLYANQNALDGVSLKKYAADLSLNAKQFELDLTDEKTAAEVRKDMSDGTNYGITGTPTIFVNGIKVRGLSAEIFRRAIEKELKK